MYGHIRQLAEAEKKGIEKAGGTVDLYQVEETLSADVLAKMHAPPKPNDVPVLSDPTTLLQYDAFLFGIPTRFGNFPAQWKVSQAPHICPSIYVSFHALTQLLHRPSGTRLAVSGGLVATLASSLAFLSAPPATAVARSPPLSPP